MKKNLTVRALFCSLLLSFFGSEALAVDCTGQCSATILPAISGSKATQTATGGDLAFGTIMPSASSGSVTIAPDTATRTASGGVQLVTSVFGPAVFNITGAANSSYSVTLPSDGTITISNGNQAMSVTGFSAAPASGVATLNGDGVGAFKVGGKLDVPANQPSGEYTGMFDVIVTYQ